MVQGQILDHVEDGSTIYTDEHGAYASLEDLSYKHETVRHQAKEFVRGDVHTNSIESVWALLERTVMGVHHNISVRHLRRYLNEVCYRLNEGNVKIHVRDRVSALCLMCAGVTLPWKKLKSDRPRNSSVL